MKQFTRFVTKYLFNMCTSARISPFMKQSFTTLGMDFTTLSFGTTLGFPAILLPQLRDPNSTIKLTTEEESWTASVFALGMLFGYFFTPPIMDRLGRKKAHCCVSVLFIIGWLMAASATNITVLILCRILQGIAGGLIAPLSTVLLAECSSPKNRGAFLSTITVSQSTGALLVHFLGSIISWQLTSLICVSFPFASLIMTIYTPESPSWLLSVGKYDKFEKVFRWFRGEMEEVEMRSMLRAKLNSEITEAEDTDKISDNCFGNVKEEVMRKEFYKPLIIMIHSSNIVHFAGGTLLMTYSTIVISILMGPSANFYMWTVFMDIFRLGSNIIAIFVIHKFKRRFMLFSAGALCVVSHIGVAGYLYGISVGLIQRSTWLPMLFLCLQLFSNAVGIVPIRYVIGGELFPLKYRGIGGSISSASGSTFMFILLKTFPTMIERLYLHGAYMVYGSIVVYNLVILWFLLPETKGRTLLQIEEEFSGKKTDENDPKIAGLNVKKSKDELD